MGYFATSKDVKEYKNEYCKDCLLYKNPRVCPVMHIHTRYNGSQQRDSTAKDILKIFIPRNHGINQECKMRLTASDSHANDF